ncbi:Capsanthin/capsorubin synthase, chromoplastic, partial [Linum perenne]
QIVSEGRVSDGAEFLVHDAVHRIWCFWRRRVLVSRGLVFGVGKVKKRMDARLKNLEIRVKRVIKEEKCLIPMGGRLPVMPQVVVG